MISEKQIRKQLKLKTELYQRGHDRLTMGILEGWINALRYVLEMPQKNGRSNDIHIHKK